MTNVCGWYLVIAEGAGITKAGYQVPHTFNFS